MSDINDDIQNTGDQLRDLIETTIAVAEQLIRSPTHPSPDGRDCPQPGHPDLA
jgi:hypothetical protein